MEYTIKKLAEMAGISRRTLRYYDEINLLKPKRINSAGYRIYGENEVNLLQEIMIYKSMDISLSDIEILIKNKDYNNAEVLKNHLEKLILKRNELEGIIKTVENTIKNRKGELEMSSKEKFENLKKEKLEENEKNFGKEIRSKYGNSEIDKSNDKFMNLSQEEYERMENVEEDIFRLLKLVMDNKDYKGNDAKRLYDAHREWIKFSWNKYTKEAHFGLAQTYIYDERFTKYYDEKLGEGATKALVKVIEIFTK